MLTADDAWIRKTPPADRLLCLLLINGRICLDVFVWRKDEQKFITHSNYQGQMVDIKIGRNEIEAYLPLRNIPLPSWATPREVIAS